MNYKKEFIDFLVKYNALTFGEFTLKSGRKSPYFFNSGKFNDGEAMHKLGYFYASKINELNSDAKIIFGPAYKGIPLAVSTSVSLHKDFNKNINITYNRKEAKDHAEKGLFVGAEINQGDKIILIDDVITSGKALRESFQLLETLNPKIEHIIIAFDRMEKGPNGENAIKELEKKFNAKISAIAGIKDVLEYIDNPEIKQNIQNYLDQYGS